MAPLAKTLAVALASSPLAAAGVGGAAEPTSACAAEGMACAARAPVLLQTHQAMQKPAADEVVLVPPYVAPPGAGAGSTRHARLAPPAQQAAAPGVLSTSASAEALENFRLLKELRGAGFTCPGGRYFPPNSGELEFDCRLWQASVGHSLDMGQRNYFSHNTPEGLTPFDRSEPYGLPAYSENIAAGGATAASTLEQWKNSDGHCTNMMDAGHNRMAVGYAYVATSTYKHYWTQLFTYDDGAVYRSCYTGEADPADGGSGGSGSSGSGSGSGSGGGGACEDLDAGCQQWAGQGYCQQGNVYQPFMHDTCKQSCGLCGGTGPSPTAAPVSCADSEASCAQWASSGFCQDGHMYAPYMREHCKSSCGLCR